MIDLHAHVVLEETMGAAGPLGPELVDADPGAGRPACFRVGGYELTGVAYRGSAFMDLDVRLARMDELGIERQVLSPNPLTFLPGAEPDLAAAFARRHNDALAALVARRPDRLGGLAQLPVQDVPAAVDELRRSVTELGLLGAYVPTDPGRRLDDPALDRLYAACVELDVPLFLHPSPGGIDGPRRDERLARFDGDLWLGFAHDEAVAVASLVLGGALARHPRLDVCVSHGGGSTSWLLERMAHVATTRPGIDPAATVAGAVAALVGRIWWDAHVGGPRALAALVEAVGTDRLVGGTNLAGWDETADPSHRDADLAATFDRNARALLRWL